METLAYGFTTLTSPNFFLASSVEVLGGTITSSPGLNDRSAFLAINGKRELKPYIQSIGVVTPFLSPV